MHKILCDTCIWLDLAKKPYQRPLMNVLFELESAQEIGLLVPRIVLDEFQRHKDIIGENLTKDMADTLKKAKEYINNYLGENQKKTLIPELDNILHELPRSDGTISNSLRNIEALLLRSTVIETTEAIMLRAAQRGLHKQAPFHQNSNSMADAIIIESFAQYVTDNASANNSFAFVTHNKKDFSAQHDDHRHPHPDLAAIFVEPSTRYFIKLADALDWVNPDAVAEYAFDLEYQPRRTDEINEAADLLWHQVWYNRHQNLRHKVKNGEPIAPDVWKGALAAAKRVEKQYGKKNLGPWDDFEWGMINGKLSALNWVMGEEWDFLDT